MEDVISYVLGHELEKEVCIVRWEDELGSEGHTCRVEKCAWKWSVVTKVYRENQDSERVNGINTQSW